MFHTVGVLVRGREAGLSWFNTPNFSGVLGDGAIGAELASGSDVHQCHLTPFVLVAIRLGHLQKEYVQAPEGQHLFFGGSLLK